MLKISVLKGCFEVNPGNKEGISFQEREDDRYCVFIKGDNRKRSEEVP